MKMSKEEMKNEENGMKTRKKERTKIIVKAAIALVFFVFEAIPSLVDSISYDGITLFGILDFISTPLSMYVIVSLIVAIYSKTKSIGKTIGGFILIMILSMFFDSQVKGMIFSVAMILIFIPVLLNDIKIFKGTLDIKKEAYNRK